MKNIIVYVVILSLFSGSAIAQAETFEATRESLSNYEVPEWYQDAKIGFFYHWGPQTALGDFWDEDISDFCLQKGKYKDSNTGIKNPVGQWGRHMYPNIRNGVLLPDSKQPTAYHIHKRLFGDPKEFGYKDLIPLMSGDGFDPERMVRLLDEAGVKYIVTRSRWPAGEADDYKHRNYAIQTERFRLLNGTGPSGPWLAVEEAELFDHQNDPAETTDLSSQYPEKKQAMQKFYDQWWDKMRPRMINEQAAIDVSNKREKNKEKN